MAGAGLIEIKRRIKSVTNTRKITKAMGVVATSKLRKTRKQLDYNNKYLESVEDIFKTTLKSIGDFSEDEEINKLFNPSEDAGVLYIIFTSDQGLCGGFNANIASYLSQVVAENESDTKIMVIGQRGLSYVRREHLSTVAEYVDINDIPTVSDAKVIAEHALRLYKEGVVSEVKLVYTHFISPVRSEPKTLKILPLENNHEDDEINIIIEPNVNNVFNSIFKLHIMTTINNCMLHSKAAEQSARMSAMDGATKNANELLNDLNIKYNRIRQTAITQEISEIVGGAEAQK